MKTEGKKPLPTDTKDGVHNRFGFKLKKPEATHLMLKKHTVFSRYTKFILRKTFYKFYKTSLFAK
jgi:hypothetical protein